MHKRSAHLRLHVTITLVLFAILARPAHAFWDDLISSRWFETAGALFVGLLTLAGWLARRRALKAAERGEIVAQTSWRKSKAWVRGVIPCQSVGLTVGMIVVGCIVGFVIVVLLTGRGLPDILRDTFFVPLLLVGAALLLIALTAGGYLFLKWRWHGRSKFVMTIVPGMVGGPLLGVIHVPRVLAPRDGFHLKLVCIDHPADRHVLREYQLKVQALPDVFDGETRIPVAFAIPFDAPQTTMSLGLFYSWVLSAEADTPRLRYKAKFYVPIVITEMSRPDFDLATMRIEEYLPVQT